MFNTIKKYCDEGIYLAEQVKIFVKAKWITELEYKEITGMEYVA